MEIEKSDLDDSLKNLCRPFNYRIPWEQTEIKSLPTRDYPEIDDRPEFSGFRIQTVARGRLNDTTVYHFNYLYRDNCHCKCILFLAGDTTSVHFKGFLKSEQIICNGFDVDGRF